MVLGSRKELLCKLRFTEVSTLRRTGDQDPPRVRVVARRGSKILTVTVSPAFAAKWLLPRIESFHAAWPAIDVRLDTSLRPADFAAQGLDIGVRYGTGTWPGLQAQRLFGEEVYPVASPSYLQAHDAPSAAEDLLRHTLIADQSLDESTGFPTWAAWLRQAQVVKVPPRRGLAINNSAAVLQAALEGQGIALARSVMAKDDISSGRLVRLFAGVSFPSPLAYYVIYRPECGSLPRLMAFRDWLFSQALD